MENKNYDTLKETFNTLSKEIDNNKKEIDFDNLLKEYIENKKTLKTLDKEFKEDNLNNELLLKLTKAEDLKKEHLERFKQVDPIEKKLYSLSKRIKKIVSSLDKKRNLLEYRILINDSKKKSKEKMIDKEYIDSLKNSVSLNEKEILEIEKQIEQLKKLKKPFSYLIYKKNDYKTKNNSINREINKSEKESSSKVKSFINNCNSIDTKLKKELSIIDEEINLWLSLIEDINLKLSFKDADEHSGNSSFIIKDLNVWYGSKQALFNINIDLPKNEIISIIGPSGCGKSTFLRTLNRINDNVETFKAKGSVILNGEYDIFKLKSIKNRYDKLDLSTLRTNVGMIFQQPNPFPMSIYKNVSYGPSVKGIKNKAFLNKLVDSSLKDAGLYEEVKDNLKALGTSLSGGQQQRLCIARAIANEPEILLMDEPTSALDPKASKKIEDLIVKLKKDYTIIMVTHSMQQAQRISDRIAFFYQGKLIEYGDTKQIFNNPKAKETKDYIGGKFG